MITYTDYGRVQNGDEPVAEHLRITLGNRTSYNRKAAFELVVLNSRHAVSSIFTLESRTVRQCGPNETTKLNDFFFFVFSVQSEPTSASGPETS